MKCDVHAKYGVLAGKTGIFTCRCHRLSWADRIGVLYGGDVPLNFMGCVGSFTLSKQETKVIIVHPGHQLS